MQSIDFGYTLECSLSELRPEHPGVPDCGEQRDGGGGRGHQGQQHPARRQGQAASGAAGMTDSRGILRFLPFIV